MLGINPKLITTHFTDNVNTALKTMFEVLSMDTIGLP